MVHAFVTVTVGSDGESSDGRVESVIEHVRGLAAVEAAHVVAGDVDVIAELEVEETHQVMEAVTDGIRSLPGVTDTKTYVSIG